MNDVIQNNLFTIILFLLFIILLLMGVIVFILFRLLTNKDEKSKPAKQSSPLKNDFIPTIHLPKKETITEKYYCHNHIDKSSIGGCLICEEVFCEECLVEHEGMYFCRDHFKIFANNKWEQVTDQRTTPDNPNDGLYIWDFKRYLWKEKQVPSFVLTHYKINVDDDFIESYVQLNVIRDDAENLKFELEKYKAKH